MLFFLLLYFSKYIVKKLKSFFKELVNYFSITKQIARSLSLSLEFVIYTFIAGFEKYIIVNLTKKNI